MNMANRKSTTTKNFTKHDGSKSMNFETNTSTGDLAVVETAFLAPKTENIVTDEDIEKAVILPNGATSIDFMMPQDEREILEKNLNMYGDVEKMQKVLNIAKKNKVISEDLKTLELVGKTGDLSNKLFDLMTNDKNLAVLEAYIQRKFDEGDIAKAYKEIGILNKAMMDARETMISKLKTTRTGKTAKIALKFTNDSGEDFQLGAEINS